MKHLVVIDGMGFVFRAYHAVRAGLTRSDGLPTNALFGFAQMLIKVVEDLRPDGCVVALDSKGPNWRHEIYPLYKANRPAPDEALIRQLEFIEPLVQAFGLPVLRLGGVEADDIIATIIANHTAERVTIVTSDKDLLQLVGDKDGVEVRLLDTLKDKLSGVAECVEKFGVGPELVADVQGLMGDSSDNIPGVKGVGPKTAADLVQAFGTLEQIYARLGEVEKERIRGLLAEYKGQAFVSRDLARLKADVVLPVVDMAFQPRLHEAAGYLREVLEFRTLAARLEKNQGRVNGLTDERVNGGGGSDGPPSLSLRSELRRAADSLSSQALAKGIMPDAYEAVLTAERWGWWLAKIKRVGVVAIDTETTGLDPYTARLVGVSLCVGAGRGCYVPVRYGLTDERVNGLTAVQGDLFAAASARLRLDGEAVDELRRAADSQSSQALAKGIMPHGVEGLEILGDVREILADTGILKIGHNLKFDWLVLANALGRLRAAHSGEPSAGSLREMMEGGAWLQSLIVNYDDTMLMSACLDGGRWGHGLDELAQRHLGHKMIAFEDVCGRGKAQVTFDQVPLEQAVAYAVEDVDATWRLWEILRSRMNGLKDERVNGEEFGVGFIYERVERPLVPVIVALEARGVRVDEVFLKELSADFASRMAGFEQDIWRLAGHEFNVQSTQQLAVVLFDELGLGTEKQKKNRSTAVGVLEEMVEEGVEVAKVMVEYRQLMKLRSTYAEALGRQVNPVTGRVHTHYMQVGASTGRFSSSDPNLQNIPIRTEEGRKIRQAFVVPFGRLRAAHCGEPSGDSLREGEIEKWVMVSADYSQIELRLLAHLSGSNALTEAFVAGVDIHRFTASLVRGVPLAEVSKEQRRAAKFINFGLVYGMGARSLAGQIGCSVSEAQEWMDAYFARYDKVREYMEFNRRRAKEQGFVETLMGRRVWLPDINSSNGGLRANAERAAINAPLQGSNADIIKVAMQQLGRLRDKNRSGEPSFGSHGEGGEGELRARMVMQVHDELVFEAPLGEVEVLRTLLPEVMGGVVKLSVPLVVEVGVGGDWDSAH